MSDEETLISMAENLTPTDKVFYKGKEVPPETQRALERLVKIWDRLKAMDEKHNIERLRLRADIAEKIRDSYTAGATSYLVAERLGISQPRVVRLVQGNYNFGPASVHRKGKMPDRLPILAYSKEDGLAIEWVETEEAKLGRKVPSHYKRSGRATPCKYCGSDAKYAVEISNRPTVFVCENHKPPEE